MCTDRSVRFGVVAVCVVAWGLMLGLSAPAPLQGDDMSARLPDGEGKGYVMTICTSCHGLGNIVGQKKTADGWEATVSNMLGRISAGMEQETEIISKYLAANFGTEPAAPAAAKAPGSGTAPATGTGVGVSHQVLFNFKPEIPEEKRREILEGGRKVLAGIPQVMSVLVGKVLQKDSEFQYGLFVGVKDEADLQTYRNHPDHQKWLQEVFRPVIAKSVVTDIAPTE